MMIPTCRLALVAALACAVPAWGADVVVQRDPDGVLTLTSSATVDVPKDWMSVAFSATREGTEGAAVQAALKEALDAALKLAQAAKRPDGQLEVRTGNFSLQPRYSAKGQMNGWSGSTEMQVAGRDMAAIAALAGRIATMNISGLDYSVSREARDKVEADVSAQAIAAFRAKAAAYAKAFGYSGFTLREVTVQSETPPRPGPVMFARARLASSDVSAPLPVDAGQGSVTSTVSGTIQMTH